jgi:hypothetical protein
MGLGVSHRIEKELAESAGTAAIGANRTTGLIGEVAMEKLGPRVRVRKAEPLQGFNVLVTFENETQREIDLAPYLHGPIFEPIRNNSSLFRAMRIEGGTIAWENGADIDPDVLYYNLKPAWMEDAETGRRQSSDHRGV